MSHVVKAALKAEWERDPDVSSSSLGQYVHDHLPRTFFWSDIDGVTFANSTRIYRVIEQKRPGQSLKPSQRKILEVAHNGIRHLLKVGTLAQGSGVFIAYVADPVAGGEVVAYARGLKWTLVGQEWNNFLSAQPCPRIDAAL